MSFETWIQEFYPQSVESTKEFNNTELIKHSLKKWEGLTRKNLNRRGQCQILLGIEREENCTVWQEFVYYNGINITKKESKWTKIS